MMKPKLLIFDLDGTLINTLKDLNQAVNFALSKYHYPLRTLENTRNDIGNGVATLIERSIPDGLNNPNYKECLRIFKEYYSEHYIDNSFPYEGIKETLDILKNKYTLAVVSNKFDEGAKKLVTHYFPNTFKAIQGQLDNFPRKPDPYLVNKILSELGYKAEEARYIGDTEIDYLTAKNSAILPILVSYGYRTEEQLKEKIKNPHVIHYPRELLDIF